MKKQLVDKRSIGGNRKKMNINYLDSFNIICLATYGIPALNDHFFGKKKITNLVYF
jgi:hypothetical protein